jgi:hypothetical protein
MRKSPAAALAVLLIVTSLAIAGCSSWLESPNKPANDAIAVANGHLKKAATVGAAVTESALSLDSIPYAKNGAASALALTAKLKTDLATQKAELEAAKAAMDSLAAMEVSEELKQYAKLESAALAARVKAVDLGTQLYGEMDKFYTALAKGKTTAVDTQRILDGVETIKRDITAVSELAAQQSKAASDYFTAQELGG